MYVPTISTSATNVELTNERRALIIKKLQPLGKLFAPGISVHLDVVLRKIPTSLGRGRYCVSAKMTAGHYSFIAMEIDPSLTRVLKKIRKSLRQKVSAECGRRSLATPVKTLWGYSFS